MLLYFSLLEKVALSMCQSLYPSQEEESLRSLCMDFSRVQQVFFCTDLCTCPHSQWWILFWTEETGSYHRGQPPRLQPTAHRIRMLHQVRPTWSWAACRGKEAVGTKEATKVNSGLQICHRSGDCGRLFLSPSTLYEKHPRWPTQDYEWSSLHNDMVAAPVPHRDAHFHSGQRTTVNADHLLHSLGGQSGAVVHLTLQISSPPFLQGALCPEAGSLHQRDSTALWLQWSTVGWMTVLLVPCMWVPHSPRAPSDAGQPLPQQPQQLWTPKPSALALTRQFPTVDGRGVSPSRLPSTLPCSSSMAPLLNPLLFSGQMCLLFPTRNLTAAAKAEYWENGNVMANSQSHTTDSERQSPPVAFLWNPRCLYSAAGSCRFPVTHSMAFQYTTGHIHNVVLQDSNGAEHFLSQQLSQCHGSTRDSHICSDVL